MIAATVQSRFYLGPYWTCAGMRWDHAIGDAPFSEQTHAGQRGIPRRGLGYEHWSEQDVRDCATFLHAHVDGWIVMLTDHVLYPAWRGTLESLGRVVFAPVPIVDVGSTCRMRGDGPSSWTCWGVISRPRTQPWASWGTTRGAYIRAAGDPRSPRRGGKPLGIMCDIVGDYSRPGQSVFDPTAGAATTLIAGAHLGRVGYGTEIDRRAHRIGQRAIAEALTDRREAVMRSQHA